MENHLVWIDLEMTGLDAERHVILEIASLVTDDQLEIVSEGPNFAINYSEDVLAQMAGNVVDRHKNMEHARDGEAEEQVRAHVAEEVKRFT